MLQVGPIVNLNTSNVFAALTVVHSRMRFPSIQAAGCSTTLLTVKDEYKTLQT